MGRIWEFFSQKYWREHIFSHFFLFSLKNPQNVWCFCCIREGGALENFLPLLLGGPKIVLGRGDYVLEGQPVGIPPLPPPLAHLWLPPSNSIVRRNWGCAVWKGRTEINSTGGEREKIPEQWLMCLSFFSRRGKKRGNEKKGEKIALQRRPPFNPFYSPRSSSPGWNYIQFICGFRFWRSFC